MIHVVLFTGRSNVCEMNETKALVEFNIISSVYLKMLERFGLYFNLFKNTKHVDTREDSMNLQYRHP